MNLLVVESPAKAKTITKYLGPGFEVLATYGHVRDLRAKSGAVDTEHGFAMEYQIIERNAKHINALNKAAKKADILYLATDPDREGEAIAWHVTEILREKGILGKIKVKRVVFYEITKKAIQQSIGEARDVSMDLVEAQQARRALDYLVGFNLSPLLWKKIRAGLSAGRVQSPALRMICEREKEIEDFEKQEYWSILAHLNASEIPFLARLTLFKEEKVQQFSIVNEGQANDVQSELLKASNGKLIVKTITKKERRRNPAAPFTTSSMQQEAARKLGFGAQRTMRAAQQLYEGIDIGEGGAVGLITYMRTDSVSLGADAVQEIRSFIEKKYGRNNLPGAARVYKTRTKNAQEAHEAIRPTSAEREPEALKKYFSSDQFRLYELIWKRAVASQMIHAVFDTVTVDFACGTKVDPAPHLFRANGSTLKFAGFLQLYQESQDDAVIEDDKRLPELQQNQLVDLEKISCNQHFTDPPPRYTEASLIRTLEEYGIGRPSTYASIVSTIINREYVILESKRFFPTDIGRLVSGFLTEHFNRYVDYGFTADLEDQLDAISRGEQKWVPVLETFWQPFQQQVVLKEETVSRKEAAQARELGIDPKSGRPLSVRIGRYGPFAQIGEAEDDDKPLFASLRSDQSVNTITMDEAIKLFDLPRELGVTAEGEKITVNAGRFGPYLRYGKSNVSIGKEDPYEIPLEKALELIEEKIAKDKAALIRHFEEDEIKIINGRYGPYVTNGKVNAKVPKTEDPASIDLEQAKTMLKEAAERGPTNRWGKKIAKKKASKKKGSKKKTTKKKSTKKKAAKKKVGKKKVAKNKASKKKAVKKKVSKKAPSKVSKKKVTKKVAKKKTKKK